MCDALFAGLLEEIVQITQKIERACIRKYRKWLRDQLDSVNNKKTWIKKGRAEAVQIWNKHAKVFRKLRKQCSSNAFRLQLWSAGTAERRKKFGEEVTVIDLRKHGARGKQPLLFSARRFHKLAKVE